MSKIGFTIEINMISNSSYFLVILVVLLSFYKHSYGQVSLIGPGRIIGGEIAGRDEVPFQTSVYFYNWFVCSGVVISEDVVLISGSCGHLSNSTVAFFVIGGDYSLRNNDGTEQKVEVKEVIVHPGYNSMRGTNDIALLRITPCFNFTNSVTPIKLAPSGHQASGFGQVTGWGATTENGPSSDIPRKINLEIMSDDECRNYYDPSEITDQMMCAGRPFDGVDVCNGDGGSPMVCNDEGENYLCGIVSWGRGCDKFPAIFTEISYYNKWIRQFADTNKCIETL